MSTIRRLTCCGQVCKQLSVHHSHIYGVHIGGLQRQLQRLIWVLRAREGGGGRRETQEMRLDSNSGRRLASLWSRLGTCNKCSGLYCSPPALTLHCSCRLRSLRQGLLSWPSGGMRYTCSTHCWTVDHSWQQPASRPAARSHSGFHSPMRCQLRRPGRWLCPGAAVPQ